MKTSPPNSATSPARLPRVTVGALVAIPYALVGESERAGLVNELTVTPIKSSVRFGPKLVDEDGVEIIPPTEPIIQYRIDREAKVVYVPFAWGMNFLTFKTAYLDDERSEGHPWPPRRLPNPNHPLAAPGQAALFADALHAAKHQHIFLLEAPTGNGKTVTLLHTIGKLQRTALVIVPSAALADQWIAEAILHLGMKREEIGLIQGPHANWQGKHIVLAVIHNLFQKDFSPEFYRYFGIVCWDEVHRLGAPEFAKTLPLFTARFRIGASATPDRKDGCMRVVTNMLGEVVVRQAGTALPCECRVIEFADPAARRIAMLPPPTILKILCKNAGRNAVITDAVVRMYKRGRAVLVLSDRIEHLQTLQTMAHAAGVPNILTALYVGSYQVGSGKSAKTKQTGQGYLRSIRENTSLRVIFATYAQMKEGTNMPWLDAGIDATPRADGEQAIGRIRRPMPGKPTPVWFTLIDTEIPILRGYATARLRDYANCGVTIIN